MGDIGNSAAVTDVHTRDIWMRHADGTVVIVENVVESWTDGEGLLVGWIALPSGREGITTQPQFLRRYRLLAREMPSADYPPKTSSRRDVCTIVCTSSQGSRYAVEKSMILGARPGHTIPLVMGRPSVQS